MMAHRKIGSLAWDADSNVPLVNHLKIVVTLGTTRIDVGQLYICLDITFVTCKHFRANSNHIPK
jgi:hypothetical protein